MGVTITDQVQARNMMNMFRDIATGVTGDGKTSAVVLGDGGSVMVSTTDKPGFLGRLFRHTADKSANNETR